MFEMANNDRAPIVDAIETEHGVPTEVMTADNSAEVVLQQWSYLSLTVPKDMLHACAHALVYTLLGGSMFVTLWFAFRTPGEMSVFQWHIILSTIGMANNDRAPIVDAIETEHGVPTEVMTADNSAEVVLQQWSYLSLTVPKDMLHACAHALVYTLLGGSMFVTLWFAFRTPGEMSVFQWHIILSTIGYQFLMPHAFLCLQSQSWAASLSTNQRRRVHWILQLVGSVLALVGSAIMMAHKTVHFNSLHGKFALAALLFTIAGSFSGVSSLYKVRLRHYISPRISKYSHTIVGIVAFVLSSIFLIYGYLKHSFTEWASAKVAHTMIAITCIYTFFVIFSPTYNVTRKLFESVKNKIF